MNEYPPIGSGMVNWLDTSRYLSADEVRSLGETRHGGYGTCAICGQPPSGPTFRLEGAHVWRAGMSGKRSAGPTVELCHGCHQGPRGIDRTDATTLAIRREDLVPVHLMWDGDTITEHRLAWWR